MRRPTDLIRQLTHAAENLAGRRAAPCPAVVLVTDNKRVIRVGGAWRPRGVQELAVDDFLHRVGKQLATTASGTPHYPRRVLMIEMQRVEEVAKERVLTVLRVDGLRSRHGGTVQR